MARDKEEYRNEWDALLKKFSPEMRDKINIDPLSRNVFMALLNNENPFLVIERLLKICEDDRQKIMELALNQPKLS